MRRSLTVTILAAVLALALASAPAQQRKTRTVSGTIKAVDANKITVTTQAGDRVVTLRTPRGTNIFHQETADESAIVSGAHAEVNGRVLVDQISIQATRIVVYARPRGFEVLDKSRIDGKIQVEDGKMTVTAKEKTVAIEKAANMRVLARKTAKADAIPVGAQVTSWGTVTEGGIEASILTFWTYEGEE